MLGRKGIFIVGFYIIGFEDDTEGTIKEDVKKLSSMKIDMNRVYILTPLPKTRLMEKIEKKYGIRDKRYAHYDGRNLVWKHPNITPSKMKNIQKYSFRRLQTNGVFFKTGMKFIKNYYRKSRFPSGVANKFRKMSRHTLKIIFNS